jgi:fused signal recognition particle receptor
VAIATGKPIVFIGVGQRYPDLEEFKPQWFADKIVPLK